MKKTDLERLKKIIRIWDTLQSEMAIHHITQERVLNDQFSQWAVTTPLYNIGEQVYQLSQPFKDQYPEIPWKFVSGLRHRLVHDYEGINWNIIAEVIFKDMDEFIDQIKEITENILKRPNEAEQEKQHVMSDFLKKDI